MLADYDAMVDRLLGTFRGHLVKTTGDGSVATFDGPGRAVECATAIREGAHHLGLEVRAGLNTGEIELRPDHDITGLAVVIAQRISATARANEILASSTVRDLTVGSSIIYEARGDHELKGVPGRWSILAAQPDDSGGTSPNNIVPADHSAARRSRGSKRSILARARSSAAQRPCCVGTKRRGRVS